MWPVRLGIRRVHRTNLQKGSLERKPNLKNCCDTRRHIHSSYPQFVQKILGIETSCDDTGCAVVDTDGNLLGDALKSQQAFHNANGGVLPPLAAKLHKENIGKVFDEALGKAGIKIEDIDAIATTVKPGIGGPLEVGAAFGSHLAQKYKKPYIPIHHMEAHALAVRMVRKDVVFPYLTLLISGGHSLLAVVRSVDEFEYIGGAESNAIGDVLDKIARRLKLMYHPEYRNMSGGHAIEMAARKATDITQYKFPNSYFKERTCDFNFSGYITYCLRLIETTEEEADVEADACIPGVENFCAGIQLCLAHYISLRVQYAMSAVRHLNLIEEPNPFLVVSGGAACNQFFRDCFGKVCDAMDFRLAVPPPKLCTDNGVMIAWNGVERLLAKSGVVASEDAKTVGVQPGCRLGVDITKLIKETKYPCDWISPAELLGMPSQNKSSKKK